MDLASLKRACRAISAKMDASRDYLIELDSQNGDGDLGISMSAGFAAMAEAVENSQTADLGRVFMDTSRKFNAAAPSSLGTIFSIGMMGMARALKGKTEAGTLELAQAMEAGLASIMEKAGSKPGEKTVLDALHPAIQVLLTDPEAPDVWQKAAAAAHAGSEATREMRSVHGRAAYYGDKSIGILDGGSVAGSLIFAAIAEAAED